MNLRKIQAVILVAGRGERLRPLTSSTPKPLLPLAGKPLLGRTLGMLERSGVRRITLVTGYRERQVKKYVHQEFPHLEVKFVRNPAYAKTNTIYSLWMARREARGESFVLIDGDLVFEPGSLELVLRTKGNLVLCDAQASLNSEAVKAYGGGDNRVLRIGKTAEGMMRPLGESIGLAKIGAGSSR
ncbi:MAG: NTP transferase domain-containing protein, partial [Terriglobia bacterium]